MQDMTSGNPIKLIVKFTIPLLIGNIFQQMYSISDIIIVGRLIGINALAALGVSAPIFSLLVFGSIGFTSGLTVITAQSFGAKDFAKLRRSVAAATLLSSAFTIAYAVIMLFSLDLLFKIMNVPEELLEDAKTFTSIICGGVIMIIFFNLLSGFMRALGDSKTPLYFLIFATILNVIFNYVFIKYFGMGVGGSALGTVSAMTISVICSFTYIAKKFPVLHPKAKDWKPNWNFYKKHLAIAVPMSIQFSIIAISGAITQTVCNSFGPIAIAGFVSAMRVEQVAMQPMISLGVTMATYVAQNYGANMIGRIRRGVSQASLTSFVMSIILALALFAFGENIINIFMEKDDPESMANIDQVMYFAMTYIKISILFYFPLGQIFIYRNALQGMGNGVIPLVSSVVELIMRAFAAVYLAVVFGYVGMCFASPIAWIGGGIVTSWGYFAMVKKIKKRYFRKNRIIVPYTAAE